MAIGADVESMLRAKFEAVLPHLDERSARLVLAAEARSLGHGGIAAVARASGASRSRIQDGVAELESGSAPLGRVRRAGGGRKPAEQADPGLVPALLALVEPTRRGDPESALSWTTLSVRHLAEELTAGGHPVSAETVGKVLRANGFSLQANAKQLEGGAHPDRDAQFSYLNEQAAAHRQRRAAGHHRRHQEEVATRGRTWRVNSQVGGPTLVGGVVPGPCSVARARSDVRRR